MNRVLRSISSIEPFHVNTCNNTMWLLKGVIVAVSGLCLFRYKTVSSEKVSKIQELEDRDWGGQKPPEAK